MIKDYLAILATTKNLNNQDVQANSRIIEIYQQIKQNTSLSDSQKEELVKEALMLKKLPMSQIKALMSQPIYLFCFPYAGGSSTLYEKWQPAFPSEIQIQAIEYPGRGSKSKENLISSLEPLIAHLEKETIAKLPPNASFAFFGHSLGALISFELAISIKKKYQLSPKVIFVSGCPSPDTLSIFGSMKEKSDKDFIEEVKELNGTPKSLLETAEFSSYFLPILKNDFSLLDNYIPPHHQLDCPLVVLSGKDDAKVPLKNLINWGSWTTKENKVFELEGDHFFIHQPNRAIEIIKESLCPKQF